MADHTVPSHIGTEFWNKFKSFQDEFLAKYGRCVLSLSYNRYLTYAYLNLCQNFVNLKLMALRYGITEIENNAMSCDKNTEVMDMGAVLPCLDQTEWAEMAKRVTEGKDYLCIESLVSLMFQKIIACQICNDQETYQNVQKHERKIKSHMINDIDNLWQLFEKYPHYAFILFDDWDEHLQINVAKALAKKLQNDLDVAILKNTGIEKNKNLMNFIAMEVVKCMLKTIEDDEYLKANKSIRKALKAGFEFEQLVKGSDFKTIFETVSNSKSLDDEENQNLILNSLLVIKSLNISILDENTQLLAIFVMLSIKNIILDKKCKKLKRVVDDVLLELYETFTKYPNIFKLFPVEYIFSFDNNFLNLLKLSKTKTNRWIVVKATLETAVKKIKTDSDIVKNLVNILLANKNKDINFFNEESNHIVCVLLPIIAKEKKNITTSQYRSILADLQESIHKFLLKSLKNINFTAKTDSTDEDDDSKMATLNALESYALTLSKCCESNEEDDINNLSTSLQFFVETGISAIKSPDTKTQHIDASFKLLNVIFRNVKKLSTHEIFNEKDQIFTNVWQATKDRLNLIFNNDSNVDIEEISNVIKYVTELSTVELFTTKISTDLSQYVKFETPKDASDEKYLIPHKVSRFIASSILKSNIVGPKSAAVAKNSLNSLKNITDWLRSFDTTIQLEEELNEKLIVSDEICEIIHCYVESLNDVIINAKKIMLNWRHLDATFVLLQCLSRLLRHQLSDKAFLMIANSIVTCLNALLLHRHELLEDRWPCYLQCYRGLFNVILIRSCVAASSEKSAEEKYAAVSHSIEKLTQALCKHKSQLGRLSSYLVADLCSALEQASPGRRVRQHYENCVVLLIQCGESGHSAMFLRRSLAGQPGHVTLTNLYTVYKRYHKYVGTS